jgi:hypothetical protein
MKMGEERVTAETLIADNKIQPPANQKRARLNRLVAIGTGPRNDQSATDLNDALHLAHGSQDRLDALIAFFNNHLQGQGGWLSDPTNDRWAEDEHFLLYVSRQEDPFWFDW